MVMIFMIGKSQIYPSMVMMHMCNLFWIGACDIMIHDLIYRVFIEVDLY